MDFQDLLTNAPDLLKDLKGLGLSEANVSDLGDEVGQQLSGGDGFDLGDLLVGLDASSFLERIDVGAVAEKIGISETVVTTALSMIAPKVAEFVGGGRRSTMSAISGLTGRLFGKRG